MSIADSVIADIKRQEAGIRNQVALVQSQIRRSKTSEVRRTLRKVILGRLGAFCANCKISDSLVLDIDHIKGDGGLHRRRFSYRAPNGRRGFYTNAYLADILKQILQGSKDFQILCRNCNYRKFRLDNLAREGVFLEPDAR